MWLEIVGWSGEHFGHEEVFNIFAVNFDGFANSLRGGELSQ